MFLVYFNEPPLSRGGALIHGAVGSGRNGSCQKEVLVPAVRTTKASHFS